MNRNCFTIQVVIILNTIYYSLQAAVISYGVTNQAVIIPKTLCCSLQAAMTPDGFSNHAVIIPKSNFEACKQL